MGLFTGRPWLQELLTAWRSNQLSTESQMDPQTSGQSDTLIRMGSLSDSWLPYQLGKEAPFYVRVA